MDILNDINLNDNKMISATLSNTVIGDSDLRKAGAIKYNSGLLSYHNGNTWVTLGSGGEQEVNGLFNVSDGTTTYTVLVSPNQASRTLGFSSSNSGTMLISMMDIDHGQSYTLTVPTTYILTTGELYIGADYSGGHTFTITHGLLTSNLIVQVWYRRVSKGSNYKIINADIATISNNVITVHVGGAGVSYIGYYRILIFRGYEQTISSGNITVTTNGSQV